MKYHVTPEFAKKIGTVKANSVQKLSQLVQRIEESPDEFALKETPGFSMQSLENDIYIAKAGTARVFFVFGENDDGKYVLLLDILEYEPKENCGGAVSRRSPASDSSLNPNLNPKINPYVNSQLNPLINCRLNPYINSSINPIINSTINPIINNVFNPLINPKINPMMTKLLNPLTNQSINPFVNANYSGPFMYDLGLVQIGFIVKANDRTILTYNNKNEHNGMGVRNVIKGFTLFDKKLIWRGQLVADGQGGFLHFDEKNQWQGVVV